MSNPKVGFVSLGCPKALVDSERILTQLRVVAQLDRRSGMLSSTDHVPVDDAPQGIKLAVKPGRGASQTGALGALHGKATTDQPA